MLAWLFEQSFFLGLLLVVLGTGLLKGNISTIVGQLYEDQDDQKRLWVHNFLYVYKYRIYNLGFLVCSYLRRKIGWHWGFGAAGIGMIFGVIQFISHRHLLGDAGMHPNEMSDEKRSNLTNYLKIISCGHVSGHWCRLIWIYCY